MKPDKRIPRNQVIKLLHNYYEDLERASHAALRTSLAEDIGLTPERIERFMPIYFMRLGEEAEKTVTESRELITRILR